VDYTNSYCWVQNTYHVPMTKEIPVDYVEREEQEIPYYQWTPLILLFMAFLFKFPCMIWRMLNGYSGIKLEKIINMTVESQSDLDPTKRDETVKNIVKHLDRWLNINRQYHNTAIVRLQHTLARHVVCFCNRREGTFLIGLYLFVKILFVINIIAQFFILDAFLGGFFSMYGIEQLNFLTSGGPAVPSHRFPRVTLCDFDIRQLNNVHRYTVQCVLPVNLFNEKIFLVIWFWYLVTAVMTCGSLVMWTWRVFLRQNRPRYLRKYLRLKGKILGEEDKKMSRKFADQYLRDDGVFILRLIAKNSTDILLTDIICSLWDLYTEKQLIKKSG
jgi:hypothetical protein